MKVIICLDDKNGMLFNKRRQSQDRYLRKNITDMVTGECLWMNEYSAKQFNEPKIIVDNDFLNKANDDFCFVETNLLDDYLQKIDTFILYRWNRIYPADFYFNTDMLSGWNLVSIEEFPGSSHEKITKEIWKKV